MQDDPFYSPWCQSDVSNTTNIYPSEAMMTKTWAGGSAITEYVITPKADKPPPEEVQEAQANLESKHEETSEATETVDPVAQQKGLQSTKSYHSLRRRGSGASSYMAPTRSALTKMRDRILPRSSARLSGFGVATPRRLGSGISIREQKGGTGMGGKGGNRKLSEVFKERMGFGGRKKGADDMDGAGGGGEGAGGML